MKKGYISSVSEDGKTAVVILADASSTITAPLTIHWSLLDCLAVNMPVVYVDFPDSTGIILARLDGEWNHTVKEKLMVEGVVTVSDVKTDSIAGINSHTHSYTWEKEAGSGNTTPPS